MPTLIVQGPESEPVSVLLDPGIYTVGSAEGNRVVVGHASVAAHHCDLTVYPDGAMVVRDAGSPGGTWIGEERIGVGSLGAGQTLRLGEVQCCLGSLGTDDSEDVPEAVALPAMVVVPWSGAELAPRNPSSTGFWAALPAAFVYPLRGDGWIPLLFLAVVECVTTFWLGAGMIGGALVALVLGAAVLRLGRAIVLTTWENPDAPFPRPDDSFEADDLRDEAWTWLTLMLVCFGPAILATWVPGISSWTRFVAIALGVLYFPMALLGVLIANHLGPLSPVFVVRSIRRVVGPYLAVAALLGVGIGLGWVTGPWANNPEWPSAWRVVISGGISLVAFNLGFVWLRVLGLLYHHYQDRLGWEF